MSATQVSYIKEGQTIVLETTIPSVEKIVIDNTGVTEEKRMGTAKQLLACALLHCYCSTLAVALENRGASYKQMRGTATLDTGTNAKGQGRVTKVLLEVTVAMSEEDSATFERCEQLMRRGCLVTSSVHEGIELEYALQAQYLEV
jgi:osmotically inducible protein OsmC